MGTVGVNQLLIILLIIVLLFGAKKIPELAKGVGKGIKTFKAEMEDDKTAEKALKKDEATQEQANETTKSA